MTYTRRIGALSALALTLVLGACSTSEDLTSPTLEPQFGTAEDDIGIDVAFVSTGRIYSLSQEQGPVYKEYNGTLYHDTDYQKTLLRRYDANGNLAWIKILNYNECDYECTRVNPVSVSADPNSNTYILYRYYYTGMNDAYPAYTTYVLKKYDSYGYYAWERSLGNGQQDYPNVDQTSAGVVVDGTGNVYAAVAESHTDWGSEAVDSVAKYSPNGTLLWQRTSTVGDPKDITVSSTGSVYVVGSAGIARYSSSGGLTWKKTGNFEQVMLSGSNIYTRYRKDIRKYDGTGRQLWLRSQSGLSTIVLQAIDGDGSGNVYLSGKYDAGSGNFNAMVRKLSSSGSVLWTRKYGTPAYDDALGIATITGSEIYTTGETQGSLAHTNIGGRDGYLRKFSSSGSALWTR